MLILALSLAPALSAVQARTLTGSELAALAGIPPVGEHLVLGADESAAVAVPALLPARSVGVWWDGELGDSHLSLLSDDGRLVAFEPLLEAHDMAPELVGESRPAGAMSVSGLVHAYEDPAVEAHLLLAGPLDLTALTLVWIAPPEREPDPPVDTGPEQGPDGGYAKPYVYSRSSWGANAYTCSLSYCNTTHIGIHHSAGTSAWGSTSWSQCASNVKSIQTYHMYSNGWCDIGYNYLVCKHGDLFEGRAGGDGVKAAHDGFNCGSMGVCFMGYFHPPYDNVPTASMLGSMAELGAWKCDQQGIDPFGSSYYAGYGGVKPNVFGHQEVKSTACPGDNLFPLLGSIKADMADKIGGGGPPPPTSGTLKGILYDATQGTGAPIAGATVSLTSGAHTTTGSNGYFQFALPAGTHAFAATAPGYTPRWVSETVSSGDVWESLGLTPANVPGHWVENTGPGSWNAYFQADAGSPIYLGYSLKPNPVTVILSPWGTLWPDLGTMKVLFVGTSPVAGTVYAQITGPTTPGLNIHTQSLLVWDGAWRLTSGAGFGTQ